LLEFGGFYRLGLAPALFVTAAMAYRVSILKSPVAAAVKLTQK